MTENTRYVGIDQSLTETGLIILDHNGEKISQELIKTTAKERMEDRLQGIANTITARLNSDDIICMEGLSLHSQSQRLAETSALHYVIRINLVNRLHNFKIVPPKTLKKWVTDNGNAGKDLMLLKIYKRWGIEFNNNNLADAYALARYAMALDKGETELPKPKPKRKKKKNGES